MIVRITAKRWDQPIEMREDVVTISAHPTRPGHVFVMSPVGGRAFFELNLDGGGERIEIVGDHEGTAAATVVDDGGQPHGA